MFDEASGKTHLSGNSTVLKISLKGHVFLIMTENIDFFFLQKLLLNGKLILVFGGSVM